MKQQHQKRLEYLVQVQIVEVRDLKGKDKSGTCDPFIKITVGNLPPQVTQTRRAANTAVFNQSFTFVGLMMNTIEFEQFEIKIECFDLKDFGTNQLVGMYSVGISTLYRYPSHEIYNKWLALIHPKTGLEPQGFMLASAYVISPDDRPPVHDMNENNVEEEADPFGGVPDDQLDAVQLQQRLAKKQQIAIVGKPEVYGKSYQLMVNIVKGEDLQTMGYPTLDSFISVRAGGSTLITAVMKSQQKPQYLSRLMFPLHFPFFNDKIVLRIWDKRSCMSDTYMATIPEIPQENDFFSVDFLQSKGGVMPFRWQNVYGIPNNKKKIQRRNLIRNKKLLQRPLWMTLNSMKIPWKSNQSIKMVSTSAKHIPNRNLEHLLILPLIECHNNKGINSSIKSRNCKSLLDLSLDGLIQIQLKFTNSIQLKKTLFQDISIKEYYLQQRNLNLLLPKLTMSPNTTFLAVGLVQGSIYIHDMALQQERFYLDKHIMQVTKLSFCDDWRLVSGSYDGSVHIYDLREGKLLCKRTNQFRKGTKVNFDEQKQGLWQIIGLGVSQSGVAAVLDAGGEVRLYDVWHGEKIAKLNAQQVMDDKLRRWNTSTPLLSCYRNEILILSDIVQEQQQTSVEIFKVFDNLINLYSSLSNVYRKGVEKEKIIHLFERLDKKDLNNPSFEVPNLATNKLAVPSADQVQSKSQSNRLSGGNKKSVFIKNDSKVQPSKNASRVSNPPVQSNEQASLVNSLHKSINSELVDFNSSYRSQAPSQNRNTKARIPQQMLTKEMLHPEQYLLEKEKIPLPYLVQEDITMVEHCRNRNAEKRVRSEKVNSLVQKLGQQMALEEEKRIKEDLQRKLKQVK